MTRKTLTIFIVAAVTVCSIAIGTAYILRHRVASPPHSVVPQTSSTPPTPKGTLEERALANAKADGTTLQSSDTTPPPTTTPPQDYSTLSSTDKTSSGTQANASLQTDGTAEPTTGPTSPGVGGSTK